LNLDESADLSSVAYFTSIEIYEVVNDDIAPESYVGRDDTEFTRHELVNEERATFSITPTLREYLLRPAFPRPNCNSPRRNSHRNNQRSSNRSWFRSSRC